MDTDIEIRFRDALLEILARLDDTDIPWALTGSLGHRLQGVPVTPHDIDLQTDEAGAYGIAKRLSDFLVEPIRFVESERIRSHLGRFFIRGVAVEVMGAVQKRLPDGSWEQSVDVRPIRTYATLAGRRIPVLSLDHERRAYEILGRHDRAELLGRYSQADRPPSGGLASG